MQTFLWRNLPLSHMMLGTVQFGLPYGVANQTGQPTYEEVVRIIATAFEGGVRCLDTAAAYGSSEEVLGRALRELRINDQVTVVTKLLPLPPTEGGTATSIQEAIEKSVDQSRSKLQLDTLPLLLFHREIDTQHYETLQKLKERGWVQEIGVSCDNRPGPAELFVRSGDYSALQIPANLLDRRHQRSGIFPLAYQRDMATFVRSAFLQGVLLMPEAQLPAHLKSLIPARLSLELLAYQSGLTLKELSVQYLLEQTGVTSVIVGVETVTQVQENLTLFHRPRLPADLRQAIDRWAWDFPESILTPSLWPTRPVTS